MIERHLKYLCFACERTEAIENLSTLYFDEDILPLLPESAIYAEDDFFRTDKNVTPDQLISLVKGTAIHATGTLLDGKR